MTYTSTRRGAQSRLWIPNDLGTLVNVWLDGTDSNSLVSTGTKISSWHDKGVNGNNIIQGNDSLRPLDLNPPSVQNTLGIMDFFNTSALPLGTSDRSIIFIVSTYSGRIGLTQFPFSWGSIGSGTGFGFAFYTSGAGTSFGDATSNNFQAWNGSTYTGPSAGTYPAVYNSMQMISMICANQTVAFNRNGNQVWSGSFSYNTSSGTPHIFNSSAGGFASAYQGGIYDMVILSSANPSHISLVEGYLAWKRGLQGLLPTTHQYVLSPPKVSA